MAENRITKKILKNHWTYNWWKYLLAIVISVFGVDLLFSVTAYRPPENRKVELYLCSGYADADAVHADFWPALKARCPEQEELTVLNFGQVLAQGKTSDVLNNPEVIKAYLGE